MRLKMCRGSLHCDAVLISMLIVLDVVSGFVVRTARSNALRICLASPSETLMKKSMASWSIDTDGVLVSLFKSVMALLMI